MKEYITVKTDSLAETQFITLKMFRSCFHSYETMHHYGDKGEHFCPTGFLECEHCGDVIEDPAPICFAWGIKP